MQEKKKSNKGIIVILILFILISITLGGYIVYDKGYLDKFLGKEKVVEPSKEEKKEETIEKEEIKTLSLNDKEVQDLYDKIKSTEAFDQKLINNVLENKKELILKELDPNILNYYGYRNLKINQLKNDLCKNYPNLITNNKYICNNNDNVGIGDDVTNNSTHVIDEEDLKLSVEEIFGKDSYQRSDAFEISWAEYYVYDKSSKRYIETFIASGGTDITYEKELIDLKQKEDSLSLIESIKFEDSVNEKISYNYKLDNDNYYLYSISLEK